ncbi:MAG: hypothetical protein JEZ11_22320 [Desulfobacterales bacterium]|nr:hypothetical protein [Desulfobacterales bacterium]
MPEVNHKSLEKYLRQAGRKNLPAAILIYGEEMVCKQALDAVLDEVLPGRIRSSDCETMDGGLADMGDVLERVNTYSLLGDGKTVILSDSRIFHAQGDAGKLLEKARAAFDRDEMKKAAGILLSLLAIHHFTLEDLNTERGRKKLTIGGTDGDEADRAWFSQVADYCRNQNLSVPAGGTDADRLAQSVEKGFASGNFLVITSDVADKRRKLYGILSEKGLVVDCSVPRGDRRSDREAQSVLLREQAQRLLSGSGKTLLPGVFEAVVALTGFDLRTFTGNLEKLVAYVGERMDITAADVAAVLRRTRQDPIYELTNAVTDRQAVQALFYLDSLLADNFHPLQILAALVNQVRKLMVAKGFMESPEGRVWQSDMPYARFAAQVMPVVAACDADLLERVGEWESLLTQGDEAKGRGKKKAAKAKTDLVIARNPKSPYPVYQTLKKCERFSRQGLMDAMDALNRIDRLLKTSGQDPRIALETAILAICR